MLISTYDRLTGFYRTHEQTIDTVLEIGQVIAGLLALLVLVSLLGWIHATAYATNWLDKLVESSLGDSRIRGSLPGFEPSISPISSLAEN